jgi:hypothetical protein
MLPAGEATMWEVLPKEAEPRGRIEAEVEEGGVAFRLEGSPFTRYHTGEGIARPFLYPILGPGGTRVTRGYPMEGIGGESSDHPHHRSLWVAHGDVNGSDNWSEEPGHGHILTRSLLNVYGGPLAGGLTAAHQWVDAKGAPVVDEERELCVLPLAGGAWILLLSLTFSAVYGPVTFGDTKEGGLVSVRVATPLDVERGGRIENSRGGVGEGQAWGRPAEWCDYSGVVGGQAVGLALLDHPSNPRHPSHWHVRDYGLMTANPFALSYYFPGEGQDGSLTLPAGGSAKWRYAAYIHGGDATEGEVLEVYAGFASDAVAELVGS